MSKRRVTRTWRSPRAPWVYELDDGGRPEPEGDRGDDDSHSLDAPGDLDTSPDETDDGGDQVNEERSAAPRRKVPPRAEIARIVWARTTIKSKLRGLLGKALTRENRGLYFWALAVGPDGRYAARNSPAFEGKTESDRADTWVANTDESRAALDELIKAMWEDGWQPTGFGRVWHDIRFRRVVPEPSESEEGVGD